METWKVMEFYNFIFRTWKVMEFEYGSWKVLKMTKMIFFSRATKQEIPRTNDRFTLFENNFSILGHGKHKKALEMVVESHGIYKIKRVRTLLFIFNFNQSGKPSRSAQQFLIPLEFPGVLP